MWPIGRRGAFAHSAPRGFACGHADGTPRAELRSSMNHFSFNLSRLLFLLGAAIAVSAAAGCAAPAQAPGPRTAAGVWQVRLPESTSPIASKAHGVRGDGLAWDTRGSDSIDEFLREEPKRVAAPR